MSGRRRGAIRRCRSFSRGGSISPDTEGIDGMVVGKQLSEEWKLHRAIM